MMKFLSEKLLTNKQIRVLILFSILVNMVGIFSPVLSSNDSNFYAVIAKHIVISNDWINLTFNNQPWLDKPHFPFWLIAISYKIFGINTYAYILPGFLFNIVGGYYTYLLAKRIFSSKEVGLLSALIYFTSFHLMLSSIDVRQEAYLLGEIMPACYYWYLYNEHAEISKKYLILGAVFTALAMMTKGIFVLLTIFSGLMIIWVIYGHWRNFIRLKWIIAIGLSFILIMPELLALYIQFDLHPNNVVFGRTNVSGIVWYFWGSQIGRFFDIGPIRSGKADLIGHYFYFIHTFLWAFLPWSLITFFVIKRMIKSIRVSKEVPESFKAKRNRVNYIYLLGTFVPTFVLFSLTRFQLDHYTNILIPFASILCAEFLFNVTTKLSKHSIFYVQIIIAYLLTAAVLILALLLLNGELFVIFLTLAIMVFAIFLILNNNYPLTKAIVYPILSICLVFVFVETINSTLYSKYDLGYQVSKKLPKGNVVFDYNVNSLSLEFFDKGIYKRMDIMESLSQESKPFYMIINQQDWASVNESSLLSNAVLIESFSFIKQEKFIPTLFNKEKRKKDTEKTLLFLVKPL